MSLHPFAKPLGLAAAVLMGAACGPADPTDLQLGETALVLSINPRINDASQVVVPLPGTERIGAPVALEPGPSATSDADGLAVLAKLEAGPATLHVGAGSLAGLHFQEGELRDVAVALGDAGLQRMADVRYDLRGSRVVEIDDTTSAEQLSDALSMSNRIVRVRSGRYSGDLVIKGSNITVLGEGVRGGQTTLTGNVKLNGSRNRIRGMRIEGDLSVNGVDATITFSVVTGTVSVAGSDTVMLENDLCQGVHVSGVRTTLLENRGAAPLEASAEGC